MVILYEIILVLIGITVLMSFMTHGFRTGFARGISALFSLAAAAACLYLLSKIWEDFMTTHLGGILSSVMMLVLVLLLYKLFHVFFSAINLIAKLPLVRWLDKGLGLISGLVEGFFVLYILQILLEKYLLV